MSVSIMPHKPKLQLFHEHKVLVLGAFGVGKTRLLLQMAGKPPASSIAGDYLVQLAQTERHKHPIKIQLWDTAGQERYDALVRSFYRHTSGVFLVYDVHNRTSFQSIRDYVDVLKPMYENTKFAVTLIANHSTNTHTKKRQVSTMEGKAMAQLLQASYVECMENDPLMAAQAIQSMAQAIQTNEIWTPSTAPAITTEPAPAPVVPVTRMQRAMTAPPAVIVPIESDWYRTKACSPSVRFGANEEAPKRSHEVLWLWLSVFWSLLLLLAITKALVSLCVMAWRQDLAIVIAPVQRMMRIMHPALDLSAG